LIDSILQKYGSGTVLTSFFAALGSSFLPPFPAALESFFLAASLLPLQIDLQVENAFPQDVIFNI
jgi:hypothetical protein